MSESREHQALVNALAKSISTSDFWAREPLVFSDGSDMGSRPRILKGFRPDVYVTEVGSGKIVIGEAKLEQDIDRMSLP